MRLPGLDTSRNNAYFQRPSAAQYHHYVFVLDTAAPAKHCELGVGG